MLTFFKDQTQNGFSLIQVIFASSVIGALTLAGTKMMHEQRQQVKLTSQSFEEQYLVNDIKNILSDPFSCKETFKDAMSTSPELSLSYITQSFELENESTPSRILLYQTYGFSQRTYGNENIKIDSYLLKNSAQKNSSRRVNLEVRLQRSLTDSKSDIKNYSIPLIMQWDKEGKLKGCKLFERSGRDPYWKSTRDQLHLDSKNTTIIIGNNNTNTPLSKNILHLFGEFKSESESLGECTSGRLGAIVYEKEKDLLFQCRQNKQWKPVGQNDIDLSQSKTFTLNRDQKNVQVTEAIICALEKIEYLPISAECRVNSPQGKSSVLDVDIGTWSLIFYGQAKENSQCVFRCFY